MATNREVAEAFVQGKAVHSENMRSDGQRLYSYALMIAYWEQTPSFHGRSLPPKIVRAYTQRSGHTHTTQRHMRELEAALKEVDRG